MADGITTLVSFIALLIAIIGGWLGIRQSLRTVSQDMVVSQVAIEHRLTQLETSVNWIRDHLPKRRSDHDDS